jgi:hypothetical protein
MNHIEIAANELTVSGMNVEAGGFVAAETPITCTPAAIDLAGVGFAAAALGYLAARAWYHGGFEGDAGDVRSPQETDASVDDLVRYRTGALGD